jgi:hypothetical protein
MSTNLYEYIIDEGHRKTTMTQNCSEEHGWQHWTATNGRMTTMNGRMTTLDGDEWRMKVSGWRPLDQMGGNHSRWSLGMLEVVARVWRLQIPTVRCRHD